jgi:hypothetical protein
MHHGVSHPRDICLCIHVRPKAITVASRSLFFSVNWCTSARLFILRRHKHFSRGVFLLRKKMLIQFFELSPSCNNMRTALY